MNKQLKPRPFDNPNKMKFNYYDFNRLYRELTSEEKAMFESEMTSRMMTGSNLHDSQAICLKSVLFARKEFRKH
jgi:ABC-type uncharacterized transport system involved in gliding motility auxiliary subunit